MTGRRRVLFLCTGNSARSQMAEAWLRALGGEAFEVHSAGTEPRGLHPLAVTVMREVGIEIGHQVSKSAEPYLGEPWDFVITLCDRARESCPILPGASEQIHWSIDDPADPALPEGQRLRVFRRVRDEIKQRVSLFVTAQRGRGR
ncbi:MAG: arsenate reductase ArsC [Chloroflexi bacterium]|nr:arsenate reductase ArsC [Chloroflexota bacterium]